MQTACLQCDDEFLYQGGCALKSGKIRFELSELFEPFRTLLLKLFAKPFEELRPEVSLAPRFHQNSFKFVESFQFDLLGWFGPKPFIENWKINIDPHWTFLNIP
jgi:hypothetical protein